MLTRNLTKPGNPRTAFLASASLLLATSFAAENTPPKPGGGADPKAAFAQLKALAGEWKSGVGKPDDPPNTVIYRVTANGNTVMETLFPGTDHEMISSHIHSGRIRLPSADRLEAEWAFYAEGKPAGTNSFLLTRKSD